MPIMFMPKFRILPKFLPQKVSLFPNKKDLRAITFKHSYYKELVRKPGKLERNKQRSKDLCWKVNDPAQSFTVFEFRNRHVSIG